MLCNFEQPPIQRRIQLAEQNEISRDEVPDFRCLWRHERSGQRAGQRLGIRAASDGCAGLQGGNLGGDGSLMCVR